MLYSSRLLILVATLLLISCTPNAVKSGATGSPTSTEPKAGAESGAASSPASAYPGPGAESDTADGQTNAYPEPGAAGSQASAYPGSGEEGAQPSPIPTTSIVEPNEIIGMPHFASPTPPPTPTRRPGPTPTAVPTKPLPSTAAGEIHYRTYIRTYIDDGDHRTYQFWTQPVDAEGAPRGEPQELAVPDQLNNPPDYAYLSPNGDYLIFMQPSMPGGVPYVIKTESGTGRPLYEEPYGGGRFFG